MLEMMVTKTSAPVRLTHSVDCRTILKLTTWVCSTIMSTFAESTQEIGERTLKKERVSMLEMTVTSTAAPANIVPPIDACHTFGGSSVCWTRVEVCCSPLLCPPIVTDFDGVSRKIYV